MSILRVSKNYMGEFCEVGGFFPVLFKHENTAYVFYRAGAGHLGRFGKINVLISTNGHDWYRQGTIQKENSDVRNPSVFIFPNGEILVSAYKYNVYNKKGFCSPSEISKPENMDMLLFSSKDKGKTWREEHNVFNNIFDEIGMISPHGRMLFFKDQLLMPVYNRDGAFLLSSADRGKSWKVFSHIAENSYEPSVVVTPNNELLAVLRAGRKKPHGEVCSVSRFCVSKDGDNKWTTPVPVTDQLQLPANLLTLKSGEILLTYGDRNPEEQRILAKLSRDNGETWSNPVQIGKTFQKQDFGYPSTVEMEKSAFEECNLLTLFYASPMKNPYFHFTNPDLYYSLEAHGYFYLYSLQELLQLAKQSGE